MLSMFPENVISTQYFASFSSILFFVEIYRRRVQTTIESLSANAMTVEQINEVGEDSAAIAELADMLEFAKTTEQQAKELGEMAEAFAKKWEHRLDENQIGKQQVAPLEEAEPKLPS
jgi:hypothetical protein